MSVVTGAYCALCRGLFSQDIIKVKWINKMNDYFLNQIHYDSLGWLKQLLSFQPLALC